VQVQGERLLADSAGSFKPIQGFETVARPSWLKWLLLLSGVVLMSLIEFVHVLHTSLPAATLPFWNVFVPQLTAWLCVGLLAPPLIWLIRRFPLSREHRWIPVIVLLLTGVAFCAVHPAMYVLMDRLVWVTLGSAYTFEVRNYPADRLFPFYFVWWNAVTYYALILSAVFVGMVGAVYAYDYRELYRKIEIDNLQLEGSLARARLQALTSQLQPHFLFNTLNSVSELMYQDVAAAERMIVRLGDLLRVVLSHTDTQVVSLQQESEYLQIYLDIEKIRFQDKLQMSVNIDPGVKPAWVPFLILQPLVENAIRHGISRMNRPGVLEVSARREDGDLCLQVVNEMPGQEAQETRPGEGLGLRIIRDRLRQLYGDRHSFKVESRKGSWNVLIRIPFSTEEDDLQE
jgi:two-component system LytT family sensor kinase